MEYLFRLDKGFYQKYQQDIEIKILNLWIVKFVHTIQIEDTSINQISYHLWDYKILFLINSTSIQTFLSVC